MAYIGPFHSYYLSNKSASHIPLPPAKLQRTRPCKVCIGQLCVVGIFIVCEVLDIWWPDGDVPPLGTMGIFCVSIDSLELVGYFL